MDEVVRVWGRDEEISRGGRGRTGFDRFIGS